MSAVVLATAGFDHKIRFWEASREKCTRTLRFPDSQVNALAITSDKQYLAAAGFAQAKVFEVHGGNQAPFYSITEHQGNVTSIGFQRDTKWMYTASDDKTLKVWDLRASRPQRSFECLAPITAVSLHPNQTELISVDQGGSVRVWDLQANKCKQEIVPTTEADEALQSVAIASDASMVVACSRKGRVWCWQPTCSTEWTPKFMMDTGHGGYLLKCVLSPDVTRLVTCSSDKTARVWTLDADIPEGFQLERSLMQHQRWVWDACFSADSAYLVTASSDFTAKLWDVQSGEVIRHYQSPMGVTCVALNDVSGN